MSAHSVKKYQLHKFWDDEFKHLIYTNEKFNDALQKIEKIRALVDA